ncbi:hypothetical protein ARAM_001383 [Aspergillus rambellii]|uniref:Uncharacterized protein n=1 Tax=Aspergillus rambellii TaxID=308745 RepID=A0A0F8WLX1_9EURO|nr:hypothetical protein ARAM_001383 [Aspergillus rambellii]
MGDSASAVLDLHDVAPPVPTVLEDESKGEVRLGSEKTLAASVASEADPALPKISGAIVNGAFGDVEAILNDSEDAVNLRYDFLFQGDTESTPGVTSLIQAAAYPNPRIVELLLEHQADPNDQTPSGGSTPLLIAAEYGHIENFDILARAGGDVHYVSKSQQAVLYRAAYGGNAAMCAHILTYDNMDVDAREEDGVTALYTASENNHVDIVRLLLQDHQADPNISHNDGFTSLHFAAYNGNLENTKLLLEHKADPNKTRQTDGVTPLYLASQNGHTEVVQLLLDKGADVNIKCTDDGRPAIFIACENGHVQTMELLLKYTQDVSATETNGDGTALYYAARNGHLEVVKTLVEYGADVNIQCNDGFMPLHATSEKGHIDLVNWLLELGEGKLVNRNATADHNWSALQLAASNGRDEIVARLISDEQVDVTIRDDEGSTALSDAASQNHYKVMLHLLRTKAYSPEDPLKSKICLATSYEIPRVEGALSTFLGDLDENEDNSADIEPVVFWAVVNGKTELLEKCLQYEKWDVREWSQGQRAPLHVAARFGNSDMIKWLLQHGADISAHSGQDLTPMHVAAENGHRAAVEVFLDTCAKSLTASFPGDKTAQLQRIQLIINKNDDGESPLSLAVKGRQRMVEELLWEECRKFAKNSPGFKIPYSVEAGEVLEMAAQFERPGNEGTLLYLMEQGAKPNAATENWTVLHWAVYRSQPVLVWWLLSNGGHSKPKELSMAVEILKLKPNQTINNLLHNPPPILAHVANTNDDALVQAPSADSYHIPELQGTIVDFYRTGNEVEMHFNQQSLKEIIYGKGPQEIMVEARRQNHHDLEALKGFIKTGKGVQDETKAKGPSKSDNRNVTGTATAPKLGQKAAAETKGQAGKGQTEPTGEIRDDVTQERAFVGRREFRWVHVPVNDTKLAEDLVTRILADGVKTEKEHRELIAFLRESWTQLTAGGKKNYMKPEYSYYYVALHDTKSRDDDQVVSRKLNSPNTILVVGQLWLWVIDEKTIITAATDQSTGFVDIVFENMAFRENNGTFQRPKSVESMMEFMLGIQTELFIKDLNHIDSKSALDVFREHIRDMANGESGLYTDFVQSLKDEKSSANGNSPATQYHNILQEAELLREIKDIRDELNILIALAVDQETVWKQLFQLEDLDNRQFHACTPSLIKEDLEDMASEAKTVQESLDSLLDLKQKQASIKEAETGRKQAEDTGKQANTIMVFTVVTIIFVSSKTSEFPWMSILSC